jgi:hypothetical protein
MNKKTVAAAFFLSLLCFMTIGSTSAQTLVGVSQGDTFTYSIVFNWNSTNPNDTVPSDLLTENQTDYYQITVDTVTSTTVGIQTTWRFQNGTLVNGTQVAEVSSGATGSIYVYAANLTAGGKLFPASTDLPWLINETIPRYYSGSGFRDTNHIAVNITGKTGEIYSYMSLYFDKATGIVVEYSLTDVYTATPNQAVTLHLLLKDTNAWAIPEFPPALLLPLFMAATTIAVIFYKRKRSSISAAAAA